MGHLKDITYGHDVNVLDIVRGKFAGARIVRLFADGSIPTVTTRSAWGDSTTANQAAPMVAEAMEIVSASANDTAAGTGARTVQIEGLNAAFEVVTQVVTLNGTTPVAIPTSLMRINRAHVLTAGSSTVNAGTLTIRRITGSAKRAEITASRGQLNQLQYTVPAGKVAFITRLSFTSLGDSAATPLAGTYFLAYIATSPVTDPTAMVYSQDGRFGSFRGMMVERVYGWEFRLTEGQMFDPSIRNDTAAALPWAADAVILEFDA